MLAYGLTGCSVRVTLRDSSRLCFASFVFCRHTLLKCFHLPKASAKTHKGPENQKQTKIIRTRQKAKTDASEQNQSLHVCQCRCAQKHRHTEQLTTEGIRLLIHLLVTGFIPLHFLPRLSLPTCSLFQTSYFLFSFTTVWSAAHPAACKHTQASFTQSPTQRRRLRFLPMCCWRDPTIKCTTQENSSQLETIKLNCCGTTVRRLPEHLTKTKRTEQRYVTSLWKNLHVSLLSSQIQNRSNKAALHFD